MKDVTMHAGIDAHKEAGDVAVRLPHPVWQPRCGNASIRLRGERRSSDRTVDSTRAQSCR